ncbi:MAG: MAPEG family protein [Hyphomonadaceae bacterium]
MNMTAIEATSIYIAINILLLWYLAYRVTGFRQSTSTSLGDGGHEDLIKTIRAHGNATEYIPAQLIGLLALSMMDAPILLIHGLGGVFTLARFFHAYGMHTTTRPPRFFGTAFTWLSMLATAISLIWFAFT